MSTKPADKPKVAAPPGDNSIPYVWTILILTGIAICTRVNFAWVGNDRQAIAIHITSRIGNEDAGANKLKNVIHLTIGNPFTTENLNRVKDLVANDKEIEGELLDRKISISPKNKTRSNPDRENIDDEIKPARE